MLYDRISLGRVPYTLDAPDWASRRLHERTNDRPANARQDHVNEEHEDVAVLIIEMQFDH